MKATFRILLALVIFSLGTRSLAAQEVSNIPESVNDGVRQAIQKRDFEHAIALYRPYTDRGNKDAEFGVAVLFILRAYVLHSDHPRSREIPKFESSAIEWLKRAAAHGNEEARNLYGEVRKRGPQALYFVSIEHLLSTKQEQPALKKTQR